MSSNSNSTDRKQTWQPMHLFYIGQVSKVVRQGGGKLTPPAGDPGESRKQRPTG